jgi:hypothetical protein
VRFADAPHPDNGAQHLEVDAAASDDGEAGAGALLAGAQAFASHGDRSLAAARQDPVDGRDARKRFDGAERVAQLVERTVPGDADARRRFQHVCDRVQLERARMRESEHEAVNATFGEHASRAAERGTLARVGRVPRILPHHDAKWQRDLGRDLSDDRYVRGQPAVVDGADDFESVGTATRRCASVGNGLDDHFEEHAH